MNGLVFCDNHGVERSNSIRTPIVDAGLNEWHYDHFGIMHQHYRGKEDNSGFQVMHEVKPALMFTLATNGFGSKSVYLEGKNEHELFWHKGNANVCFISGEGGQQVNLNKNLSLDLLSIVIPQHSIEKLIEYNEEIFSQFSLFTKCQDNTHLFLKGNRPVEKAVIKAANDLSQARLMGNNAHRYMESKIIDCLSGFLVPGCLAPGNEYYSLLVRDKMHDVKDIILSQYHDMPSLHEIASMVGTNECTLKKAFKYEFGTTVFQFLFDYRISWCLARSGQPDEWGETYNLSTWDKQSGTDLNGGSYWYKRTTRYNIFNHGPIVSNKELNYQVDKRNLFWPIPNSAITANTGARLRQNYGYDGYDEAIPMFTNWEEAVADEELTK